MKSVKAILVQPGKHPKAVTIDTYYKELQKLVGGYIEVIYPYEDNVALVMNEEGKLIGLQLNRALKDKNGMMWDIIAGDFLVVGIEGDDFCSLTEEQAAKYEKLFYHPEYFIKEN